MNKIYTDLLVITLGLIIGSFLNVCIYRIPKGKSVIFGRSYCMNCGHQIRWYELIPVLSYLFLGGKCSNCKQKLSLQYPLVELLNGAAYLWIYYIYGLSYETLLYSFFVSALIIISFIDWKIMIIPDSANIFIFTLGLVNLMLNRTDWLNYVIGLFAVSSFLVLIAILTKGQMGGGDIKLMAASGLLLGWKIILLAFILGVFIAAIISIIILIVRKGKSLVPFGPYLSIGLFVSILYGDRIINWYINKFILI
ncbi:MAG: prepilin peptidase [Halanaerobiales bacterium]